MIIHRSACALLLAVVACGPDSEREEAREYASALCEAMAHCECAPRFDEQKQCEDSFAARFNSFVDADYAFDRACFDRILDSLRTDPCDPIPWNGEMLCSAFSASRAEGASCAPHGELPLMLAVDCGKGLVCHDGTCTQDASSGSAKAEGEACNSDYLGSCHAAELYCGSDDVCHVWNQPGDSCEPFSCIPPLFCEGSGDDRLGVCAGLKQVDETCEPLDWGACEPSTDPGVTIECDAQDEVCTIGQPLCANLNLPTSW